MRYLAEILTKIAFVINILVLAEGKGSGGSRSRGSGGYRVHGRATWGYEKVYCIRKRRMINQITYQNMII